MDFMLFKSTKDENTGVINYRYTPSPSKKAKDKAAKKKVQEVKTKEGTMCGSVNGSETQEMSKRPHDKRIKVSLGIAISRNDWNAYISGDYDPDKEMRSIGITFDKFSKLMDMIRKTVSENRNESGMKFIVQSAMMKLITAD